MITIYPSILTSEAIILNQRFMLVKDHVQTVHIDVMDGRYVDSHSLSIKEIIAVLDQISYTCNIEMHLMVKEPAMYISVLKHMKHLSHVILHADSMQNLDETIHAYRELYVSLGLSFALGEEMADKDADFFVVMTEKYVGHAGTPFYYEALKQIPLLKQMYPDRPVAVDGGITFSTAKDCVSHGANRLIVNSAIFTSPTPLEVLTLLEHSDE